jgi:hypothetical protein
LYGFAKEPPQMENTFSDGIIIRLALHLGHLGLVSLTLFNFVRLQNVANAFYLRVMFKIMMVITVMVITKLPIIQGLFKRTEKSIPSRNSVSCLILKSTVNIISVRMLVFQSLYFPASTSFQFMLFPLTYSGELAGI